MFDGIRWVPMGPDQSCQAQLVTSDYSLKLFSYSIYPSNRIFIEVFDIFTTGTRGTAVFKWYCGFK